MAIRIGNPLGALDEFVSPAEINLGFQTGFILEFRHARGLRLPAALANAGNDPKAPGTLVFQLNPSEYTITEPFTSEKTPVESNEVIVEENGIIMRTIVLEGTTGVKGSRRTEGPSFSGVVDRFRNLGRANSEGLPGIQDFLDLRDFFRAYARAKQDPEIAEDIQMILHVLRDDDHFLVIPDSFTTPRDANSTRIHYKYRIELTAIAEVESKLAPVEDEVGFGDGFRTITEGFHDARAAFAETNALAGVLKRRAANVNASLLQAAGLINSVGNLVNGFKELIDTPREQFSAGVSSLERAAERLANIADPEGNETERTLAEGSRKFAAMVRGLDQALLRSEKFGQPLGAQEARAFAGERLATGSDVDQQVAGAGIGTRTRVLLGSGSLAGLDVGTYNSAVEATIRPGDTVASLAAAYDSAKEAIVLINNLRYPYITPDGGPGLKQPGDTLLVPVVTGSSGAIPPSGDYLSSEDVVYGVDLKLDETALEQGYLDIAVDEAGGSLDAAVSRGLPNYLQGLAIILHTERGSTKFIRELGIRRTAGIKGTLQNLLFASVALRESILSDPRTEGIVDAKVVLVGDSLEQEITTKVRGRTGGVPVALPYGKASGE